MKFSPNGVYHVYNQGNNREPIFFQERNYRFFLDKMRKHLLPHVDLLAYCLMPNHFHWLVRVKPSGCELSNGVKPISKFEMAQLNSVREQVAIRKMPIQTLVLALDRAMKQQNLCFEIGQLTSSYAKAINKQQNRTGSLFRKPANAKDGMVKTNEIDLISGDVSTLFTNKFYQQICFNYIHQNPVKAGLVDSEAEWEFSSSANYLLHLSDDLCDVRIADEMGLLSLTPTLEFDY